MVLIERLVNSAVAAGGERLAGVHIAVQADGGLLAGGNGVDGKLRAGVAVAADEDVRLRGLIGQRVGLGGAFFVVVSAPVSSVPQSTV